MSKVAVIAKLTAAPGKRDELAEVLRSVAIPGVADEEGTEIYAAVTDNGDDDTVWFFELYRDEASLDAHGKSDNMARLGAALGGLLAGRPELHVGVPVAAKGLDV